MKKKIRKTREKNRKKITRKQLEVQKKKTAAIMNMDYKYSEPSFATFCVKIVG